MKKILILVVTIIFVILSYIVYRESKKVQLTSVGFLFPDSMYDQTWGTEGNKGMLDIVQTYDTAFFYEQHVNDKKKIGQSVKEMSERHVQILFGQGREFEEPFNTLAPKYKDIHFVIFNGKSQHENVTAINIDGYAMGFLSGMIASHESHSKKIGIVGAIRDQSEIKGFIDGAQFENKNITIDSRYLNTFSYNRKGKEEATDLINNGADIIFPATDSANQDVLQVIKTRNKKAIGYINNQSNHGAFVLTSVELNLASAYKLIADEFTKGNLKGGTSYLGIDEGMVGLSPLSYEVSNDYIIRMDEYFEDYKKTHHLPTGSRPPKQHDEYYLRDKNN